MGELGMKGEKRERGEGEEEEVRSRSQATQGSPESSSSSCRVTGHRPVRGHLVGIRRTLYAVTSALSLSLAFFLYVFLVFFSFFLSRTFSSSLLALSFFGEGIRFGAAVRDLTCDWLTGWLAGWPLLEA